MPLSDARHTFPYFIIVYFGLLFNALCARCRNFAQRVTFLFDCPKKSREFLLNFTNVQSLNLLEFKYLGFRLKLNDFLTSS